MIARSQKSSDQRSTLLCISRGVFISRSRTQVRFAADAAVQVQLDVKKAGPRAVEDLTERGILRDYRFAWTSMAQAFEFNTFDPLEGPFSGEAKHWLRQTVTSQQQSGLSHRYTDQNHRVDAVFYSPEGDVMELHDTAQYHLQILDGRQKHPR